MTLIECEYLKPSEVSSKKFKISDYTDDKELVLKHQQQLEPSPQELKWDQLKECLFKSSSKKVDKKKQDELKDILDKFKLNTRAFINEDCDSATLNDTAYYLFQVFYYKYIEFTENLNNKYNNNSDNLIYDLNKLFQHIFPLCSKSLIEKTFNLIENLMSFVNERSQIDSLFKFDAIDNEQSSGDGFVFNPANVDYVESQIDSSKYPFSIAIDEQIEAGDEDEEESDEAESDEDEIKFNFPTKSIDEVANAKLAEEANDQANLKWVSNIDKEILQILYEMLSSTKTNDSLQNELLELLGFEKCDLISDLLVSRVAICQSYKRVYIDNKGAKTLAVVSSGAKSSGDSNTAAVIGSDIIVHTKGEKKIKKLMRKEEKKLNKLVKSNQIDYEAVLNEDLAGIEADKSVLRKIREEQLSEARLLYMYNQNKSLIRNAAKQPQVNYPFVFDRFLKSAQTMAHVAGAKILLPENIKRYNDNRYEEIYIPAVDAASNNDLNVDLVSTSILDQIGQIAFRNVKQLNRIQSIVFEKAYYSNENLLICAPTGAGKTNIAMLAIVNEINKNFEMGVLKKDNFKIVYIAPMKALAAEMVENFSKRLEPLGIVVKELTGDMQLTKKEVLETQILVSTPEKWDVVTRKSLGDISLSLLVRLLIIDEVHLLHDDRGSVIETIVARTLRQVETTQKMIRIVGLSATLPNYIDVARFLNVNPMSGLFFFDGRFRPVPLEQTFIGVKGGNKLIQMQQMEDICYDKVLKLVRNGHQVMVFVHARNATIKTALKLRDTAKTKGDIMNFLAEQSKAFGETQKNVSHSRNKQLREIFEDGFGVHHAGMLRQDRNLVEKAFLDGHIRVLVCTATLAWGVNLPAHAVVIKGTEIYDSKKGSFVDISMLDILQIFGRAGRPQFDKSGEAFIITSHDKLSHYLNLLTRQSPIESQFVNSLADNLNAEVCLGTVTNIDEGVKWLSYTYLHVRMRFNPLFYGLTFKNLEEDPLLELHRFALIKKAAEALDKAKMIRYDERTGYLHATDLGRTASHYYIKYDTIEVINEFLNINMNEKDVFSLISNSSEFQQLKVRDEELPELDGLLEDCPLPIKSGIENTSGKVNLLIQSYISRARLDGFSLVSDMAYVSQNVTRIARALFEIVLKQGWSLMSGRMLNICKIIERQIWHFQNPLRQFESQLPFEILSKMDEKNISIDKLREMNAKDLGSLFHHQKMGDKIKECISYLPMIDIDTTIHPITRTVLRVRITLISNFKWNDKIHGSAENFWVWIEDPNTNHIYHHEYFTLQKKHVKAKEEQLLVFTIPIFEPLPSQYIVRVVSDKWLGVEFYHAITFKHLILPDKHPPHTELLDLDPLPKSALHNIKYEALYNFSHFNPIQTQIFHCFYHTDNNCLLGAPTGSGKTITAELAIFRVFNVSPEKKVVYIAPLKALVRERMIDWKVRLEQKLGKRVVELTGDVAPDMKAVADADVIVTTPEKWDGISRSWQTRNYVKDVALIIIDEIHLLGEDRGPVLEVIVSRTNFISSHTSHPVRIIGLSTALANARDLADWLGIKTMGLYNFKPSVRPVPLEVHIQGYPGKFYCPRQATMNKPCYQEIKLHSPIKPVLIFVSSRRQTRLTALDLISHAASDLNAKQWLHMPENEINNLINQISDQNLKHTLAFGIGLHHAGLNERDRRIVEELFVNQKIQILVATSTLAWGVNFPAHLVIVKGTEFYDGKTKRYIDYPITDVLQMMGRAGRPQYDDQGKAIIMVHDVKKHFYKKFLYEPFPVESSLLIVLPDHLNAEIVAGTITTKQEAMDYLTWTFFFRRLIVNPTYYQLEQPDNEQINKYLSKLIQQAILQLVHSSCINSNEDDGILEPTTSGRIASFYYLSHKTMKLFNDDLKDDYKIEDLIGVLSSAHEYNELPVRHNEDQINTELNEDVPIKGDLYLMDSPHTKCSLLLQAHYGRLKLPSSDYITDLKTVMDQCLRILQGMLDFCADRGWLQTSVYIVHLMQMTCQGHWLSDSDLLILPHITTADLNRFFNNKPRIDCLPRLIDVYERDEMVVTKLLGDLLDQNQINEIKQIVEKLPLIDIDLSISGEFPGHEGAEGEKLVIKEDIILTLYADSEYVLQIDMKRLNKIHQKDTKAYTPHFAKSKDEHWIVIFGDCQTKELVALKRINYIRGHQINSIQFYTPIDTSQTYTYSLFFMSDVYLGLDQQYEVKFKCVSKQ